jgi:hypothetical protein
MRFSVQHSNRSKLTHTGKVTVAKDGESAETDLVQVCTYTKKP